MWILAAYLLWMQVGPALFDAPEPQPVVQPSCVSSWLDGEG